MKITKRWLKKRRASPAGLSWFAARFPDGAEHEEVLAALRGPDALGDGPDWHGWLTCHVAIAWAATDPSAAVELAATIQDEHWRGNAQCTVAIIWARTDPRAAAEYAAKIQDDRKRGNAQCTVACVWAATDLHAAAEYAAKIQNDFWRGWALSAIERIGGGA